ncbi:hypothetical protein D5F01_LYC09054 [Larimichthys crocea]|uniref:Uncharacterized protein n=1 Tax=Larimichthys crocea TaxID=215358 RepID=A0A6G0IK38_LARCR|nr:hypothetical protein D5F01_LYC09054 [Larimichthys crocea]
MHFTLYPTQVRLTLSQKDVQLQSLQKEHLELMRQLTTTQENLQTKEQSINQLEARYLELEAQLAELQTESSSKDDSIQYLQNEKIVLEVALQAARADKSQLDEGAQRLGEDVLVASDVLDQLRQEVQVKANQVETLQQENRFPEETSSETEGAVPTTKGDGGSLPSGRHFQRPVDQ